MTSLTGISASGGATILKPSGGWASPELEKVFSAKFDAALLDSAVGSQADTTESPPNISGSGSGGLSGGAIAGIVIGAIFGVAIVVLGILFLYRRTRKKRIAGDIQEIGSAAAIHRENKELPDSGIVEMEGDLSKEMPAVVPHELEGSAGANSTDRKVGCQSGRGV